MSWRGRENGKEIRLKGGKKSLKGRKMLKEEAGSKSRWGDWMSHKTNSMERNGKVGGRGASFRWIESGYK